MPVPCLRTAAAEWKAKPLHRSEHLHMFLSQLLLQPATSVSLSSTPMEIPALLASLHLFGVTFRVKSYFSPHS